jgi:hypothetical protein
VSAKVTTKYEAMCEECVWTRGSWYRKIADTMVEEHNREHHPPEPPKCRAQLRTDIRHVEWLTYTCYHNPGHPGPHTGDDNQGRPVSWYTTPPTP